ncbi:YhfC family glutamic-type intramembrane protease [Enterococcus sp. DIV0756]|uniref:YhfC family glutamic-type intramembrane protease n=1 Tax=Enterococcus sp. DIV0756 TaxID=2774636 RepID=UPI003F684EAF
MLIKLLSVGIGIALPIGFLVAAWIKKVYLKPLLIGVACFVVSQILIRIPLLQLLAMNDGFRLFEGTQPFLYGILLAFSAGVFEETGRLIFMKWGLSNQTTWNTGLWFGLGHGGIEALLFYGLPMVMVTTAQSEENILIGGVERLFAMLLHVGLSLLVLYGIQKKQKYCYFLALFLHTLVNSLIVVIPLYFANSLMVIEGALILISSLLFLYTLNLKRKWGSC